jgi:transposase InsO family protein
MRFRFIEEHVGAFETARLCKIMDVSSRGLRAFRNRPASRRQQSDLVTLAHIKEQSRLSLGSYGRPRMTEELKEIGLDVGHRRVGRLMRQNGISVVRTRKHKVTTIARQAIAKQSAERGTAITSSISRPTCWIVTSTLMRPTKSGQAISVIFGRVRGGCIWPSSWTCIQGA